MSQGSLIRVFEEGGYYFAWRWNAFPSEIVIGTRSVTRLVAVDHFEGSLDAVWNQSCVSSAVQLQKSGFVSRLCSSLAYAYVFECYRQVLAGEQHKPFHLSFGCR